MYGAEILDDLEARGLVHTTSDRDKLATRLAEGPTVLYCGFDPTSDSLHIGSLMPLLFLRRFQDAGHKPIALAGGATGMVGDPSFKSDERNLLDDETISRNLEGINPQLRAFLDFDDKTNGAKLLDNRLWTLSMSSIEFLRDVGKHITIGQMLAKESVKARLEGERGISYTEFSYMLLQANDFAELHRLEGCELQVGGSDQWGNISLGIDLTRRVHADHVHGVTHPLLTRSDGTKYGKTATGENIWLDPEKTSVYQFFQSWMQVPDEDIEKLLLWLTFLPPAEARGLAADHLADPGRRLGQTELAKHMTTLVHGEASTSTAFEASRLIFSGDVTKAPDDVLRMLARELPSSEISRDGLNDGLEPEAALSEALDMSKGEVRRLVKQGGIRVNGRKLEPSDVFTRDDLVSDRYLFVRKGKSAWHVLLA